MISRAIETWSGWPTWAKWTSGLGAVVVPQAAFSAAGESDFVSGFGQEIVATVLRYGLMVVGVGVGIWMGMQVAKRTRTWFGWTAGLIVFSAVMVFGTNIAEALPGVGWRIKAMNDNTCHTDWDGRSNPTVCD